MSPHPSAFLFYGYIFPTEVGTDSESADGTYCNDMVPVRVGHYGRDFSDTYVALTSSEVGTDDCQASFDPVALAASLPADADEQILAFVQQHGITGPNTRTNPDSDWDDSATTAVGWWLVAHYA